jgi:hypothetical protein
MRRISTESCFSIRRLARYCDTVDGAAAATVSWDVMDALRDDIAIEG